MSEKFKVVVSVNTEDTTVVVSRVLHPDRGDGETDEQVAARLQESTSNSVPAFVEAAVNEVLPNIAVSVGLVE